MGKAKRKGSQSTPPSVTPLLAPILALQNLLTQFNNQGVIIGGVAASLLGTPRFTVDLDAVILLNLEDIPKLISAAAENGIEPRIPNPIPFARKNRVLLLRHSARGTFHPACDSVYRCFRSNLSLPESHEPSSAPADQMGGLWLNSRFCRPVFALSPSSSIPGPAHSRRQEFYLCHA